MKADYQQLLNKLTLLRRKDKKFKIFGSAKHRYILQSPLPEEQIKKFERKLKISLPQEYRDFLRFVGGSGAGPYYGLVSLQENCEDPEIRAFASQDFWIPPSYDEIMKLFKDDCEKPPKDAAPKRKKNNHPALYCPAPGILPLSNEGCGYFTGIVLNGPEKGTMWTYVDVGWIPLNRLNAHTLYDEEGDTIGSAMGMYFHDYPSYYSYLLSSKNRDRIGFYDWYNTWLTSALNSL